MANKIFVFSVVVLWLSSMTWLVSDRILPSLWDGEPPATEAFEIGKAVAWNVEWEGKSYGEAASVRLVGADGTTDLHTRLRLKNFPLMKLAPSWMRLAVGDVGRMTFDALTRIEFDPLGSFSSFNSRISLNELTSVLRLSGRIKDSYLELKVRAGTFSHVTPVYLPDSKALNEALIPASRLPRLRKGRYWQEEVYSPFRTPGDPVELVRAEVIDIDLMQYQGDLRKVFRVEYRGIKGSGIPDKARLLGISWVDTKTAYVLRRDVFIGPSKLRFDRVSDEEAEVISEELFENILQREIKASSQEVVASGKI